MTYLKLLTLYDLFLLILYSKIINKNKKVFIHNLKYDFTVTDGLENIASTSKLKLQISLHRKQISSGKTCYRF